MEVILKSMLLIGKIFNHLHYNYYWNWSYYHLYSGIDIHHPQFQGHAIWGANFCDPPSQVDDHGHGTHVAGNLKLYESEWCVYNIYYRPLRLH